MKDTLKTIAQTTGFNHRMKYMQLVDFISNQIENDLLKINDRLPSLNQLTKKLAISKETAQRA